MERQYIGARYVPKFWDNGSGSTEWTPNIPYGSMVVVTYMNNSYTSKVPVPATQVTPNIDTEHCLYKEYAERLIESGYGDVSEYKAKIDVLDELKRKYGFYTCCSWHRETKLLAEIIDKFIEEIQNEN